MDVSWPVCVCRYLFTHIKLHYYSYSIIKILPMYCFNINTATNSSRVQVQHTIEKEREEKKKVSEVLSPFHESSMFVYYLVIVPSSMVKCKHTNWDCYGQRTKHKSSDVACFIILYCIMILMRFTFDILIFTNTLLLLSSLWLHHHINHLCIRHLSRGVSATFHFLKMVIFDRTVTILGPCENQWMFVFW